METTPPPENLPAAPLAREAAAWGSVPTVEEVDRIVALADPVMRNFQVTQAYHELSLAVAALNSSIAYWCTFAIWASKQAGATIRQEDLGRLFERLLGQSHTVWEDVDRVAAGLAQIDVQRDAADVRQAIRQSLDLKAISDRTSGAVSRGNTKVFEEIGREFARFLATFRDDTAFDAEKIARFGDVFRPGGPPDGQDYLKRALTHVYQARFESQPKAKAELTLLANLEIGFHEQTRLQPEIAAALDAPIIDPDELKSNILAALARRSSLFLRLRVWLLRLLGRTAVFDRACEQLAAHLQEITHRVITECLMTLELPTGQVLRLGQDVPGAFPETLRQLTSPELQALVARLDPTPDSMRQSGADDWTDFVDRMHYIADLFRAYQEQPRFFDPAFTPAQVLAIKAGRIPEGRL